MAYGGYGNTMIYEMADNGCGHELMRSVVSVVSRIIECIK